MAQFNPKQKRITVYKAKCDKQHLYTQFNLEAFNNARKNLNSNAFILWTYIAQNQENYKFALSNKDFTQKTGIGRDAYNSAVAELITKGYLVLEEGKTIYSFYETPSNQAPEKYLANAFIYAIYYNNELWYIGKTSRKLEERIKEHISCVLDPSIENSQQNYLYKAMRECGYNYNFKVLYESHNAITNHQLEEKEKELIETLKPKYNYEGIVVPYRFTI